MPKRVRFRRESEKETDTGSSVLILIRRIENALDDIKPIPQMTLEEKNEFNKLIAKIDEQLQKLPYKSHEYMQLLAKKRQLLRRAKLGKKGGQIEAWRKYFKKEEDFVKFLTDITVTYYKWYKDHMGTTLKPTQLAKKLAGEFYKETGEPVSERTMLRYIERYNLLGDIIEKEKAVVADLEQSEYYKKAVAKIMTSSEKPFKHISQLQTALFAGKRQKNTKGLGFYIWMLKFKPEKAQHPMMWTQQDVREWLSWLKKRGIKQNTRTAYLVGLRLFWMYGLDRDEKKLKFKEFGERMVGRKTPEYITYFRNPRRLFDYIPKRTTVVEFINEKGKTVKRTLEINSKADYWKYKTILAVMLSIGSRTGDFPDVKHILNNFDSIEFSATIPVEQLAESDWLFKNCHGTVSIRLQDLTYIHKKVKIPIQVLTEKGVEQKHVERELDTWMIRAISEKKHVWYTLYLTPTASKFLEKYLRLRFGLDDSYTGKKLERWLKDYVYKKVREGNKLLEQLRAEKQRIENEVKDLKKRRKELYKIVKTLMQWYKENMLLFGVNPNDINTLLYVIVDNARKSGNPIYMRTSKGDEFEVTPELLYVYPHKGHLLRKTFAQQLYERGVPLEVISNYGVGWTDLTTLKQYYSHVPHHKLLYTYFSTVSTLI